MKLHARIFLAYFLILGAATYYLMDIVVTEIKPAMRQSTEEVLVDVSNLLAELVEKGFSTGDFSDSYFAASVERFLQRSMRADIFSIHKDSSNFRIYITDKKGIVRYHSEPEKFGHLVGADFSRWNDVYLTLKGKYGARSTKDIPGNDFTTVMYVAAPIIKDNEIVGVLTVGKHSGDVQPFIDIAVGRVRQHGLLLVFFAVLVGAIFSFWLTGSIRRLAHYAQAVGEGKHVELPKIKEVELQQLGDSMEMMRKELEGKNYVEQYVHTLTHEFKSPIAAISGAAEVLSRDMSVEDFERFTGNIRFETARMNDLVNRLLELVSVEKKSVLEDVSPIRLSEMVKELINLKQVQINDKKLKVELDLEPDEILGDQFLLKQCIDNLIQNALDFSEHDSEITITLKAEGASLVLSISDQGVGIPDYALSHIFERFYSLPRPGSDKKSSGIGLSFVQQVVKLHHGEIKLQNNPIKGVTAQLRLPLVSRT